MSLGYWALAPAGSSVRPAYAVTIADPCPWNPNDGGGAAFWALPERDAERVNPVAITVGLTYLHRMDSLASRIRHARTVAGLTQAVLSERMGIARPNVSQWEAAITRPDGSRLALLAGTLGVSVDWLLKGEGDAPAFVPRPRQAPSCGPNELPVFRMEPDAALTGTGLSVDPMDYVRRPDNLRRVQGAYAVLVTDSRAAPTFRFGDTVFINPHLPPRPDNEYLVVSRGDLDRGVSLATLVSVGEREMVFAHLGAPGETVTVSRAERRDPHLLHRVVGVFKAP